MNKLPVVMALAGLLSGTAHAADQVTTKEEKPAAFGQPAYGAGMMGRGMMGSGMMSGGMMDGGMMGGGTMGPGMMGGGMMGRGMMGPGMMMGGGMTPGMMGCGMGPYYTLNLTDDQRAKVDRLQDELRKKNWETIGKIMDEQAKLRELYAADKRDPAAIGKEYDKIAELRRHVVENSVETQNRIDAVLTPDQREQLKRFGPGWRMGADS